MTRITRGVGASRRSRVSPAGRRPASIHALWGLVLYFFFNDTTTTEIYTLSLHDALPIYNTGVQVADVVVGFIHIEKMSLADIKALDRSLPNETSFDYYCWDLYTRVGLFYRDGKLDGEQNPEKLKLRAEILHAIEAGNNSIAELADYVATRNVEQILDTMERLGIRYDLLARESEILHLHFWERAFQLMKERGVIQFDSEGRTKGCSVRPLESQTGTDVHESDTIIVRSNGT